MSNRLDYFQDPNLLINSIKANLKKFRNKVEKIYIIGSLARKDFMIDSDVDLLIVTKDFQIIKEIQTILDEFLTDNGISYDLITLTPTEFMKRQSTILIQDTLREGIEL